MGEKVYKNGTGHMTMMAALLIYGKNLQKLNRPRYQVSVYRTIGPLVFLFDRHNWWPVLLSLIYYTALVSRIEIFPASIFFLYLLYHYVKIPFQ